MNSQDTSLSTNQGNNTEPLGPRWKSADCLARLYGKSRPWVYAIADRFTIRNVSLGAPGKTGARLFDSHQLEEIIETLAEIQKGKPRINPRRRSVSKTEKASKAELRQTATQ
ncbi:MAG: hypothetical protein EB101_07115 [Chitinophagia bacterium]|nr:hypothetical protein [Chitinophagia bacterium]